MIAAPNELMDVTVRRMRWAIAAVLVAEAAGKGIGTLGSGGRLFVTGAIVACLLAANGVSRLGFDKSPTVRTLTDILTISLDVISALAVVTTVKPLADEVRWALLVVPILEGAVRFRLVGAVATWAPSCVGYLAVEAIAATTAGLGSELVLARVATLVQRSGMVLLVAVPGGYLSDHLLRAASAHRTARRAAARRNRLLEVVLEAGQRVNRLGGDQLAYVASGARSLHFDVADVCVPDPRDGWVATSPAGDERGPTLPAIADQHEAMMLVVESGRVVVMDGSDGERARHVLGAAGLSSIVFAPIQGRDGTVAVLRAGTAPGSEPDADQISCLQLLASEATVALDNVELVARIQTMHESLEYQANHDPLTGLPNRRNFVDRLSAALAEAVAGGRGAAVLFLDLDGFKEVNDTHGHEIGDELLVAVAGRLSRCLRGSDLIARLGGDEFTVLVRTGGDGAGPIELSERLLSAMAEPFRLAGHSVRAGVSIGVALPERGLSAGELMRRADLAMYKAKKSGSGGSFVYGPALDGDGVRRARIAADLRAALDANGLDVAYQPVVEVSSGRISGFEALARWTSGPDGLLSPEVFIPIAEDSGVVCELGEWIMREACRQVKAWQVAYELEELDIAVNVSPRQLAVEGFADRVGEIVRGSGLDPHRLVLEVTERVLVERGEEAVLAVLRQSGIRIAVDDFGLGRSSMNYLQRLPLDILKIDRSFVQSSNAAADGGTILRSLVTLGHDLGLEVVAEGVEEPSQLETLRMLGCDSVQGFLLHRPLSAADASRLLQRGAAAPQGVKAARH